MGRVVLGGSSAARLLGWQLSVETRQVEVYVAEAQLATIVDQHARERDDHSADLVLRAVAEP